MKAYSRLLIVLFTLLLFATLFSCTKKEEPKQEIIEDIDRIIDEENLEYLYSTRDFMESFMFLKKNDIKYADSIAKPSQFEKSADRKTMLLKFGILCSDIAYAKIIGNIGQMPEYDKLLNRYIVDLNIGNYFYSKNKDYFETLTAEQLTDSLFEELVLKFRAEHKSIVDRAYKSDEEFLIYFTLGVAVERLYLQSFSFLSEKSATLLANINNHNKTASKENKLTTWQFFYNIYQTVSNKPRYKNIKEELDKIKDVIDLLHHKIETSSPYTYNDIVFVMSSIRKYRNDILNN